MSHPCAGTFIQENSDFQTLLDLLPSSGAPAIFECPPSSDAQPNAASVAEENRKPLTHAALRKFIADSYPEMLKVRLTVKQHVASDNTGRACRYLCTPQNQTNYGLPNFKTRQWDTMASPCSSPF